MKSRPNIKKMFIEWARHTTVLHDFPVWIYYRADAAAEAAFRAGFERGRKWANKSDNDK